MTYDPEVERAWTRAAPVTRIMSEGLWLYVNANELKEGHNIWVAVNISEWIMRILPEIDEFLQDPEAFVEAIASNQAAKPERGRVSAAYSPKREEEVELMVHAFDNLRSAVVQWSGAPVQEWETLESALGELLQSLHRFDPFIVEQYVKETQTPSLEPNPLLP